MPTCGVRALSLLLHVRSHVAMQSLLVTSYQSVVCMHCRCCFPEHHMLQCSLIMRETVTCASRLGTLLGDEVSVTSCALEATLNICCPFVVEEGVRSLVMSCQKSV